MLYTGRSQVIPYHLQDIGSIGSWLAIFAIVEKNHVIK
jgi:hypothetical protein